MDVTTKTMSRNHTINVPTESDRECGKLNVGRRRLDNAWDRDTHGRSGSANWALKTSWTGRTLGDKEETTLLDV